MTRGHDFIRFHDQLGNVERAVGSSGMFGWAGPWPPPEELWLLVGGLSGGVTVLDPTYPTDPAALEKAQNMPSITIRKFRLATASQLPDDADMTHVARGAEYWEVVDAAVV